MERVKGIEPSSVAWEATALPLSYTRVGRSLCPAPTGWQRDATTASLVTYKLPPKVTNMVASLPPP